MYETYVTYTWFWPKWNKWNLSNTATYCQLFGMTESLQLAPPVLADSFLQVLNLYFLNSKMHCTHQKWELNVICAPLYLWQVPGIEITLLLCVQYLCANFVIATQMSVYKLFSVKKTLYFVVNKLIACLQQVLAQFSLYINKPKYKIGQTLNLNF